MNSAEIGEKKPKVFVSYCRGFGNIKDLFVKLLNDIDIETVVFDRGSRHNPSETEKILIEGCDGLLGILTPDKKMPSGLLRFDIFGFF